ncbi:MAG: DNA repair protein RadA [Cyanothece sp. SIO2G6]|nr:DNA repair protein RadA [Cyanothece sp. SIO2G6]
MAKARSQYVCQECGANSRQYFGKCPFCGSWNSLVEETVQETTSKGLGNTVGEARTALLHKQADAPGDEPRPLAALTLPEITDQNFTRLSSGYGELDRVLGGGIVPGSLVLVGGDPGIGKSTLLLQVANVMGRSHTVLYVCAEESGQQVKLRAQRLGVGQIAAPVSKPPKKSSKSGSKAKPRNPQDFYVLPETDLETILTELGALRPQVAVIDSIQALYFSALNSAPGSVAQVRECTSALMHVAKRDNITLLIVGHVTKEGAIAGPKVLEHLVDTVLYFEGDRFASHRLLRSVKNRFGATQELGIFEMADQGLTEVLNPSELFMGNGDEEVPGIATIVACEGTRPLVVELQALVSPTSYASPRRTATGIEYNRLLQILAVLEKRVGIPLSKLDAYVASSGGLAVAEPAADLGVAVAVAASFRDRIVNPSTVLIGEVGLGGQVRTVSQMERRLKEAAKLGFTRAIIPAAAAVPDVEMDIVQVKRVVDAIGTALSA